MGDVPVVLLQLACHIPRDAPILVSLEAFGYWRWFRFGKGDGASFDERSIAQDHRALENVLHLAHVAGPVMRLQFPQGLSAEPERMLRLGLGRLLCEEMVGQECNVSRPFAQGRQ